MAEKKLLMLSGIFGATGVMAGAFGAHGLEERLSPELLEIWNTGAEYHLYHALALLGVACLAGKMPESRALKLAGTAFVLGVFLFSGSLYLLALTGARWMGAITPFGGVAFVVGWLALIFAGLKRK